MFEGKIYLVRILYEFTFIGRKRFPQDKNMKI